MPLGGAGTVCPRPGTLARGPCEAGCFHRHGGFVVPGLQHLSVPQASPALCPPPPPGEHGDRKPQLGCACSKPQAELHLRPLLRAGGHASTSNLAFVITAFGLCLKALPGGSSRPCLSLRLTSSCNCTPGAGQPGLCDVGDHLPTRWGAGTLTKAGLCSWGAGAQRRSWSLASRRGAATLLSPGSGHSISVPGSFDLGPACPVRPESHSPGLGRMSQRPRPLCIFLCWEDLGDQKWVGGILVPGGTGLEEF